MKIRNSVLISTGTFAAIAAIFAVVFMSCPDESGSNPQAIEMVRVTGGSFQMGKNRSADPSAWGDVPTGDNNAVWDKVQIVSGNGYRLPTEAQWEYAAKSGNPGAGDWVGYTYSGSNTIDEVAWYSVNTESKTHEVGKKAPNGLGLYDMSGNVWEWCWDWHGSYESGSQNDPSGAASGSARVLRGGSWFFAASSARSAYRTYGYPFVADLKPGIRLVRL